MNHSEPMRLEIERYISKELDSSRVSVIESHLKECNICSDYYSKLISEGETFLRIYSYSTFYNVLSVKNGGSIWQKVIEMIFRPVLVPVYATLLIAAIFAPIAMNSYQNKQYSDKVLYKGVPRLTFAYQREGMTAQGSSIYRINKGDRIQIFYTSDRDQYVALFSIDGRGEVSFYQENQNTPNCSVPTSKGNGIAFPGSIQFDEVYSDELVVLVLSDIPLKTADVKKTAQNIFTESKDLSVCAKGFTKTVFNKKQIVQTLLLKKE